MNFLQDTFMPHVRLSLLRHLASLPGYLANESLLTDAVNAWGLPATRDQVRTCIGWLAEQGLVTAREIGGLVVARITLAGEEAASGRRVVAGVRRPSAG